MSKKEIDVFISYHMDTATDTVEKIDAAFTGAGIRCWYAKKDIDGAYAGQIVDAIWRAKVFLLILNEKSSISGHVLNEFNIAFDKLNQKKSITILPFKIEKCEISKDAYYYLNRFRIMDGSIPPEMLRVKELTERVKVILGNKEQVISFINDEALHMMKEYRLIGSNVYPDNHFVGRTKELSDIHESMQVRNRLFLIGMGGIGKSELAKMYCYTYKDNYDVIVWVSYNGSLVQTFSNDSNLQIQGLNRLSYIEEDEYAYFKRKMKLLKEIGNDRVLLVIDNFDVKDDPELQELCSGPCSILFTSRIHPNGNQFMKYEIPPMANQEELFSLFKLDYLKILDETGKTWVEKILKLLNGHPLSVRLVAGTMQSRRIAPEKMYHMLADGIGRIDAKNEKVTENILGGLKKVFCMADLSEDEKNILKNLALLPLNGVEVEAFYEWCGFEDYEVIDNLIGRSWVIHNTPTDEVHLHPMITEVMLEELKNDLACCNELLNTMIHKMKEIIGTSVEEKMQLLDLLISIRKKLPIEHPYEVDIEYQCGIALKHLSLRAESTAVFEKMLDRNLPLEIKLRIYNQIAHNYSLLGQQNEAAKIAQKGLKLLESIEQNDLTMEEKMQKSTLEGRLCEVYRKMGEYDLSVTHGQKRVQDCDELYGAETAQLEKGWARFHLATSLYVRNQGDDIEKSEQLHREAIGYFEAINDQWSQAYCHLILSQIYMQKNQYHQALEEINQTSDILVPQVGSEHIDIGKIYYYRGNIHRHFKEEEKALEYYKKAVAIVEKLGVIAVKEKIVKVMESGQVAYSLQI